MIRQFDDENQSKIFLDHGYEDNPRRLPVQRKTDSPPFPLKTGISRIAYLRSTTIISVVSC